jgi:uncharacterized protein (DUF1684 family)
VTGQTYLEEIEAVRRGRLERLTAPHGWLSLVGLEWLKPGENRVGAATDADVVLRGVDAPPFAGTIELTDASARFTPAPRADVTFEGRLISDPLVLRDDLDGEPTLLEIGTLSFHLIRRGERLGIRVRDVQAESRTGFAGLRYFAIDPSWRIDARFETTPGRRVDVPDVFGVVESTTTPGILVFERDGAEHRLDALLGDDQRSLWLIFGDATNASDTYAGGRFLYTQPPAGDRVVVDFNLAYNPPCVFTPYATCPLPWPANRLDLAVTAGEKRYGLD